MSIKSNGFIIGGQRVVLPVDPTLTISGDAADAKVVGDKFNSLTLGVDPNDRLVYLYIDGHKQGLGVQFGEGGGGGGEVRRNITYILPHATSTNRAATVPETVEYTTVIAAEKRYNLTDVVVTMGGVTQTGVYDPNTGAVTIPFVRGDIVIEAQTTLAPIDLLDVDWADHAISCGQSTNNYNAWSPHNMQYDDVNDKWLILQCHSNKHLSGTYTSWTLSVFNPYDPTDVTNIVIPQHNSMGSLWIENGVWWIFPKYQTFTYRSADQGQTWETLEITRPSGMRMFGIYKCGDTYFSGNDSNTEITYYKSSDLLNWEVASFDSSLGYECLCETTFCEFNGRFWAFNRTNDATLGHPVILVSDDEGATWQLWSDQYLHGFRSTVSCQPFRSYIMIADIDRDGGYVYYSKFDGQTIEQIKSWRIAGHGDDFHNINLATNYTDTVVIEFMHGVPYYDEAAGLYEGNHNKACDNVMLVGSTRPLPHLNLTTWETVDDFKKWMNANCTTGLNENAENEYRWVVSAGMGFRLQKKVSGSWTELKSSNTFEDEISVPLGFTQFGSSAPNFFIKDGDDIVKLWHNNYTAPRTVYYNNYSNAIAVFSINDVRYEYGAVRSGDLPVLIRVPYKYNLPFSPSSTQNQITGEEWQAELPLRKVFNVCINKSNASLGFNNGSYTSRMFGFFEYVPAATEEAGD